MSQGRTSQRSALLLMSTVSIPASGPNPACTARSGSASTPVSAPAGPHATTRSETPVASCITLWPSEVPSGNFACCLGVPMRLEAPPTRIATPNVMPERWQRLPSLASVNPIEAQKKWRPPGSLSHMRGLAAGSRLGAFRFQPTSGCAGAGRLVEIAQTVQPSGERVDPAILIQPATCHPPPIIRCLPRLLGWKGHCSTSHGRQVVLLAVHGGC